MKKRLIPRLILTIAITLGFIGWMWFNPPASEQNPPITSTFSLMNPQGEKVTHEALKGKYSLVFFGFTHCPDICPTALLTITTALNQLGADAANILPVFITVDPERDTPQVMGEYIRSFHPSFLALTGTPEEVTAAQNAYKVYASRQPAGDRGEDYTVNHSGYIYLMDEEGQYMAHFAHTMTPEALAAALREYLGH